MELHESTVLQMAELHEKFLSIFKHARLSREDALVLLKSVMFDVLQRMSVNGFKPEGVIGKMVEEYAEFCKHVEG